MAGVGFLVGGGVGDRGDGGVDHLHGATVVVERAGLHTRGEQGGGSGSARVGGGGELVDEGLNRLMICEIGNPSGAFSALKFRMIAMPSCA